jgi:hypothetical protein
MYRWGDDESVVLGVGYRVSGIGYQSPIIGCDLRDLLQSAKIGVEFPSNNE